jgi:pimeloyl-ACP methyl ester carboxylesterase
MAKAKASVISPGMYSVVVRSHTGLLIIGLTKWRTVTGSAQQLEDALRQSQLHNWVLGWWSWYGWIFNLLSIRHNGKARRELRRLVLANAR